MTPPPEWLSNLANEVAAHIQPFEPLAPVGCHYHQGEEGWEITVFVSATEVVGGPQDGNRYGSRFRIDLKHLLEVFSEVNEVEWQAQRLDEQDELGAHLSIEGLCSGEPVWVRIPASAPARFEPGRQMHVHHRRWKEVW